MSDYTVSKAPKSFAIAIATVMIIIGILLLMHTPKTIDLVEYAVSAIIFAAGIYKLLDFIAAFRDERRGWTLVLAIILIGLSVRLLFHGDTQIYFSFILVMCAFILVNNSITKLFNILYYKKAGLRWGWLIIVGCVNTALAISFILNLVFPDVWLYTLLEAILLIADGGILFIEAVASRTAPNRAFDMPEDIHIIQ